MNNVMTTERPVEAGDDMDWLAAEPADMAPPRSDLSPWQILLVDDDPDVHVVIKLALRDVLYDDRPLCFLSAHTAREGLDLLARHQDIAVVVLDVVMESEHAGLELVERIRKGLGNESVRIILHTGQPGHAPERDVIVGYDINDYKAKAELTSDKLFTAIVAALRSYKHIRMIESSRQGLEKVIEASASMLERRSLVSFAEGVLLLLRSILPAAEGLMLCAQARQPSEPVTVLAAAGMYRDTVGRPLDAVLGFRQAAVVQTAMATRASRQEGGIYTVGSHGPRIAAAVVCVSREGDTDPLERHLLDLFCRNVVLAYENIYHYEQAQNAVSAAVVALGRLAEFKDEMTGEHVRRVARHVAETTRELRARGGHAELAEVDDTLIEMIGLAAALHDVGKVGIPDQVLKKPGKLDADEWAIMVQHVPIGADILDEAGALLPTPNCLALGAIIAQSHHEKFDGSGYPLGLAGNDIPLIGRITAVADVFDALTHKRPYKHAWPTGEAIAWLEAESGRHFDPAVVDAFLATLARAEPPA